MSDELNRMQNAIVQYLKSKSISNTTNKKSSTGAVQGTFTGNKIRVGNKTYDFDLAVDMALEVGDTVWCLISDNGSTAVVVGM